MRTMWGTRQGIQQLAKGAWHKKAATLGRQQELTKVLTQTLGLVIQLTDGFPVRLRKTSDRIFWSQLLTN